MKTLHLNPYALPILLLAAFLGPLAGCGGEPPQGAETTAANPLLRPRNFRETAPDAFRARFQTTKGTFVVQVNREWAPRGADRFYNLLKAGFYDGMAIHRVLEGFTTEFGIHGDPWVNAAWRQAILQDDPVAQSNLRGRIAFSKSGPNSRTVQVFVNTDDNPELDAQGFAPFGEVVEGMDVIDAFYADYGDGPPRGEGVYQAMAIARGDEYLKAEFPLLDRIQSAVLEDSEG